MAGFPAGVEVAEAVIHGGPCPAATRFGAPRVGTRSIRRAPRPRADRNPPEDLPPAGLAS